MPPRIAADAPGSSQTWAKPTAFEPPSIRGRRNETRAATRLSGARPPPREIDVEAGLVFLRYLKGLGGRLLLTPEDGDSPSSTT